MNVGPKPDGPEGVNHMNVIDKISYKNNSLPPTSNVIAIGRTIVQDKAIVGADGKLVRA